MKLRRLGSLELNEVSDTGAVEEIENSNFNKPEPECVPAVGFVNSIIEQAVRDRASDIHLEPGEKGLCIRFRIDGILRKITKLPIEALNPVVSRIKIMSGLDIAKKRLPQDGHFNYTVDESIIDIRVSTFPTVYGEKVVLRLLDKKLNLLRLEELGFTDRVFHDIQRLLKKAYGMILVTGPTGSGKTTTMYSLISSFNSTEKNIITLEDPVEYLIEGINQTSVNPRAGLTFPVGIRSILRQDPDIVMVGEIRDLETAQIAIRAANTGHLLLSTLHTGDAPSALTRLIEMGIEPYLVASSVIGIISQRLVRKVCRSCIQEIELPPKAPERDFLGLGADEKVVLHKGRGCSACGYTGYYGRVAIGEVLIVSDPIRRMVLNKESANGMLEYLKTNEDYTTLLENGISKVKQGVTTIEEIARCL
jgi:type IV pilus assembly protein PilB